MTRDHCTPDGRLRHPEGCRHNSGVLLQCRGQFIAPARTHRLTTMPSVFRSLAASLSIACCRLRPSPVSLCSSIAPTQHRRP